MTMKPWDFDAQQNINFIMPGYWQYQALSAIESGAPILNAASSHDPARLHRFGAVNLDIRTPEELRRIGAQVPPNYKHGSVFAIPFPDNHFQTVVLGEFLEHCVEEAAHKAVKECARVLRPTGRLIITVPLDGRPNGHNRPGFAEGSEPDEINHEEREWSEGVTSYHQTWWSNEMLHRLRNSIGFVEIQRISLLYVFTAPIGGWGMVWEKPRT